MAREPSPPPAPRAMRPSSSISGPWISGPKPSTVASRRAVTPSTAPALSTVARVTARSRSAVRNVAIVAAQSGRSDGKRRHQPIGAPVGDAGDDKVVARGDAGDLLAVRHGAGDQAGRQLAHADLVAAVADREPAPRAGQEQVVERRGPGRDVDTAHVARPAVGAAAAALDGDGMADAARRAKLRDSRSRPADRRRRPRRPPRRRRPRRPPRARRRRRACRPQCAPARRRPPARPPAAPCRRGRRSRARRPRRAARRSR